MPPSLKSKGERGWGVGVERLIIDTLDRMFPDEGDEVPLEGVTALPVCFYDNPRVSLPLPLSRRGETGDTH